MTDTSGAIATPNEPAEPVETEYKVHPSWEEPLSVLPESLRGPIIEKIRSDDANVQRQLEAARANSTPEEWRELIQEAQKGQVTPAEIIDAYNDNQELVQRLNTDPWGFLDQLTANIDAAVAAGQISAREGAALKKEGAAAVSAAAEELGNDDPNAERISKLENELAAERSAREAAMTAQQQQAEQQAELAAQQLNATFRSAFDEAMVANGFATIEGDKATPIIAPETILQIAKVADELMERSNDTLSPKQAIDQAVAQLRTMVTSAGGRLPTGPAATGQRAPQIPVGGGSAQTVAPSEGQKFASKAEREAAMIAYLEAANAE